MKNKQELQKELSKIVAQERKDFTAKHYPECKAFEGRYFKYRNSYGGDNKGWWLYTKVVEVKPEVVYEINDGDATATYSGWSFQTDTHKQVSIEKNRRSYLHSLGKEISETEFIEAWNKMVDNIDLLP